MVELWGERVGLTVEREADGSRVGSFGWFLEREYWGRGYATEAASLLLAYARGVLRLDRVRASCDAGNVASERVMKKLGLTFEREGPRQSRPGRRLHYGLELSTRSLPTPSVSRVGRQPRSA